MLTGKCSRGGRGGCIHAASSEDPQKTSLAKGEGGQQVSATDRAPERSWDAKQEALGSVLGTEALAAPGQERSGDGESVADGRTRDQLDEGKRAGKAPGLRLWP